MTTTFIHQAIATTAHSSRKSPMAWLATLLRPLTAQPGAHTRAGKKSLDADRAAAAVRAMAYRHRPSEPGYAADLFAAADRHQSMARGDTAAAPATPLR